MKSSIDQTSPVCSEDKTHKVFCNQCQICLGCKAGTECFLDGRLHIQFPTDGSSLFRARDIDGVLVPGQSYHNIEIPTFDTWKARSEDFEPWYWEAFEHSAMADRVSSQYYEEVLSGKLSGIPHFSIMRTGSRLPFHIKAIAVEILLKGIILEKGLKDFRGVVGLSHNIPKLYDESKASQSLDPQYWPAHEVSHMLVFLKHCCEWATRYPSPKTYKAFQDYWRRGSFGTYHYKILCQFFRDLWKGQDIHCLMNEIEVAP